MHDTNPLLHTALAYVGHGLSVIPVTRETKAPRLAHWQPYQERRATPAEVARWFTRGYADAAVAVVAGPVSGNLEVLDFDAPDLFAPWLAQVQAVDPQLAARLVIHRTQHGGYHVLYRSPVVAGNQKLAVDPERPNGKLTLIETRGAGGYVLAPPSAGYLTLQGGLTALPELPAAARETLLRLRELGAVAADLRRKTDEVTLERELIVRKGLQWWEARGAFLLVEESDHNLIFMEGSRPDAARQAVLQKEIQALLEETAAFRSYYVRAAPDRLVKIEETGLRDAVSTVPGEK